MPELNLHLRPNQAEILDYRKGFMGISAVPGSGKTWTLSLLAADIIARGILAEDQEILIVTLVNSAVDNFYQRINSFVHQSHLIPNLGYRVRTLHGLAHDIVRERPELAGLDNNFTIIDEREATILLKDLAVSWLHTHAGFLESYLNPDLDESRYEWLAAEIFPEFIQNIASDFIRYAKDLRFTPNRLHEQLNQLAVPLPLVQMGVEIFADYQRALAYRGSVDFDDLIRLALTVLETDEQLLERLRFQWPYILEDEAQDSSRLQESILQMLAGERGNWVRVGEPNQAIYETFTTANPRYLMDFISNPRVAARSLPNSGRSTLSIIQLANYLAQWTSREHPVREVRDALTPTPEIKLVPEDDPQSNPLDELSIIHLARQKFTPQQEIQAVVDSIERWLPEHPQATLAVLVPRNQRAFDLIDAFRTRKIEYSDVLLRSSSTTRFSAGALANILRYLSDPQSPRKLATVYRVWRRNEQDETALQRIDRIVELIRKCRYVEDFLWPGPARDWLDEQNLASHDAEIIEELQSFRLVVRRWLSSILLPVDQIVLSLSQDLLKTPSELAIAHKLALLLRRAAEIHPSWHLPEMTEELGVIARNERRYLGFSDEETGFDPDRYLGKVVVSTIHKAKGLEWDRVYIMSVNNYDFPSAIGSDQFIAEKWFLRDHLNLEAEALAQLDLLSNPSDYEWYQEGTASRQARLDYVRERLRLFYVGITRARKELIVTWNSGRKGDLQPSLPLAALQEFWDSRADHRDEAST